MGLDGWDLISKPVELNKLLNGGLGGEQYRTIIRCFLWNYTSALNQPYNYTVRLTWAKTCNFPVETKYYLCHILFAEGPVDEGRR